MTVTDNWRKVDELSRRLTLAVKLIDEVSGDDPIGEPRVEVAEVDEHPIRNRSGYYLFFDLPGEEVTVEVDGGDLYHDGSTTVDRAPDDGTFDAGDAVELSLSPTPAYPYPRGLTRVRGTVFDGTTPVGGATMSVVGHSRTTMTTDDGEFAYYFDDIDPGDIEREDIGENGDERDVRRFYRPGGSDPEFEVDGDPGRLQRSVPVEVGRLTTLELTY